jgi:hypothetical protein
MFSNSRAVNVLAGARIFLFASRDVWFVVGVPVFLRTELGWTFWQVGTFLAVWVIGLRDRPGVGAGLHPRARRRRRGSRRHDRDLAGVRPRRLPGGHRGGGLPADVDPTIVLVGGLIVFGVVFAANSAVHSFLILATPTATRSR